MSDVQDAEYAVIKTNPVQPEQEESVEITEYRPDAELTTLIEQAQRKPRTVARFRNNAMSLCTLDREVATECMYALKRSGKTIEGPSARMAEILASEWGNCRASARVVSEDYRFVTAEGIFIDLEKNSGIRVEVKRRITDSKGRRYNDDMIGVTANAACSIAMRNAVLKGIPKALWRSVYDAARHTAIGDQKSLATRRQSLVETFAKMGVTKEQILEYVEKPSLEDMDLDDVALMVGVFSSLRNNEAKIDEVFAPKEAPKQSPVDAMKEKGKQASKPKSPPTGDPTPEEVEEILRKEREGNS